MLLMMLALRLYPRRFRDAFEAEMLSTFNESQLEYQRSETLTRIRFLIRELIGVLAHVPAEWVKLHHFEKNVHRLTSLMVGRRRGFFRGSKVLMTYMKSITAIFLVASAAAAAEQDFKQAIISSYEAMFSAMAQAKTQSDLEHMVDAMDAPEWVASLPAGETMTRSEAIALLKDLLAIAPEKRVIPHQQIVYMTQTGWNVLVTYWVYRPAGDSIIGSLARDTWVRTAQGWRRIRHEKFFPDRSLVENGKAVLLPTP